MFLGVDLGQKTTGLAISQGQLASPYKTITHESQKEAVEKINQIANELNVDTLVVGVVDGRIKSLFENFVKKIRDKNPSIDIVLWDETLTTRQARETMIKLQVPKKKRANMEHQVAASLILQSYLDSS